MFFWQWLQSPTGLEWQPVSIQRKSDWMKVFIDELANTSVVNTWNYTETRFIRVLHIVTICWYQFMGYKVQLDALSGEKYKQI